MTKKEKIMNIIARWLSCLVNRTSKICKEPYLHPLLLVPRALIWSGFILIVRITVKITVRMEKSQSSWWRTVVSIQVTWSIVTCQQADCIHMRWQKSKSHTYTLIAYTWGGQKPKSHAYTLISYTCGGQKSRSHTYMLIAYTYGGQKS